MSYGYRNFNVHACYIKVVAVADLLNAVTLIYNSSLEGAMRLKLVPFSSSWDALSVGTLFSKLFLDSENQNHGL